MSRGIYLDLMLAKLARRLQLIRGWCWKSRGVDAGLRFGVGRNLEILFPGYLVVGNDVTVEGPGYMNCLSEQGVRIGNHSSIDRNIWVHCGGSSQHLGDGYLYVGDHSFIGCNAVLGAGGGITIGENVLIGQCVNIHAENHLFDDPSRLIREQGVRGQGVQIEDDVWIGSRCVILDGVTVHYGAVVAAGAVVTKNVPPYAIVAGVPARVVKMRNSV